MDFEWDEAKDLRNRRKHGIAFSEACQLFESESDYLEIFDEAHSDSEDRFIAIGRIARGIVVIVYSEPEEGLIRIISARRATRREQSYFRSFTDKNR